MSSERRLDFIWSSHKDLACVKPLYDQFIKGGWQSNLVKLHKHNFRNWKAAKSMAPHVVASYDFPIQRLKRQNWHGKTIYVDHGVGPIKYYAYRYKTLHELDLLFYQGDVFRRKMEAVNPNFQNGLLGGFTKMDELVNLEIDREKLCAKFGLEAAKPIILFAPTWGGKRSQHWGIRNAKHLQGFPNLVIAPHPGDYKYASRFGAIIPESGNINKLIKLCDVLISDVSSVVGEAAAINKPTIQLVLSSYPGCFPEPDMRNEKSWLSEEYVKKETAKTNRIERPFQIPYIDEDWIVDRVSKPADLWHNVEDAINDPDKNAKRRRYWGEQCCWNADGLTCQRIGKMIKAFVKTGQRIQID